LVNSVVASALGIAEAELQQGRWQAARAKALPYLDDPEYGLQARGIIANASMQCGDYAEAQTHLKILLKELPSNQGIRSALSVALNNLGSEALNRRSALEAENHYREALAVDEHNSLAWFNLAVCAQKRNDLVEAAQAYKSCVALDPSQHEARIQWAVCERVRGALAQAREALSGFGGSPPSARLAVAIGTEWGLLGDPEAAARAYSGVTQVNDADAKLILRIARAQLDAGENTAARDNARRARVLATDAGTQLRSSLIEFLGLPAVPRDRVEIKNARNVFARGIATLASEWPVERLRQSKLSLDDLAHSHYLLAYQGEDDAKLASSFGRWYGDAAAAILHGKISTGGMQSRKHARRIALVSARWNTGTINAYFGSWIGALTDAGWDVQVFHLGGGVDKQAASIAKRAGRFHHLSGPLENAVAAIQSVAPAIILYPEIGLSPRVHAVSALRLAPVQAAAWGHPVSSGLDSIDTWFSCLEMEPADAVTHYCEKLVLLPRLGTNYRRPERARAMSRSELGVAENQVLYLAPHAPVKLQPEFDDLLAGIAEQDSQAKFVMFEGSVPALTEKLRERIRQRFDQQGIDFTRHMIWLPRAPLATFRSLLASGDVLLDTPGFSGGNTSLDAIGQGLPLITLPGLTMRSRQSAAMLRMCGAGELIATTPREYIDRALRVTQDIEFATRMRQKLLASEAGIFDDQQPLRTLVECMEQLI